MFTFFDSIVSFFQSSFEVLGNFLTSLVNAVGYVSSAIPTVVGVMQYMPAFIGGCGLAVLSIAIVKFTIGR